MITVTQLKEATEDELKAMQEVIVDELKRRRAAAVKNMKDTVKPGDRFMTFGLSPDRHNGKMVTVKSVKKTRASVQFDDEKFPCTIPLSCMKKVEEEA